MRRSRDSPAARGADHGEAGCAPAARGGPWWSRWMPKGGCDPMGTSRWSRLLPGPVEQETHAGAGLLAGLVTPWGTHARAACS